MKQVMNCHKDNGLLNMIRRTDPMINEDFGMTDQLADYIDSGRIQLFVVDSMDRESWSCKDGIPEWRAARQEQYYRYIVDEAIPLIRSRNPEIPAVTGFSMGANHAVITFLRSPQLFRGV